VQQLVRARQRVFDPELRLQNADRVFAPQTTDPVIPLRRTCLESFEEEMLLVGRKLGRRASSGLRSQCRDASIAIGIRPTLHEPSTARQPILNGPGFQPFENQQDDAISIALLGVPLGPHQSRQRRPIPRRTFLYVHA